MVERPFRWARSKWELAMRPVHVIWRVLGNRRVQLVTRITGTLGAYMIGISLLVGDSGHPATIWEILGFMGVALVVPSIPPQTYYWFIKLSSPAHHSDKDDDSLPNRSQLSRWHEHRRNL
jgi:hypothetical protein